MDRGRRPQEDGVITFKRREGDGIYDIQTETKKIVVVDNNSTNNRGETHMHACGH